MGNYKELVPIILSIGTMNIPTLRTKKKVRIMQGIRLWHCINTYHTGQFFILPRKKKAEEVALPKI